MTDAVSSPSSTHFDHLTREPELYSLWENIGAFQPTSARDQSAPVFNIAMPPPNANGELHLGHSLGYTVMDILGRYHRLCGHRVMLLPGKDHAGIQTQVVFEKLLKSQGVDHKNVPTKELYRQCFDFCIDRANYMRAQEKRLGISADWSRELFTLDPALSRIVFETFKRMWDDGLVYRKKRIINWSVFSQTALSDVEVEFKEVKGNLWFIQYPWVTPPAQIAAAQSRPLPTDARIVPTDNHSRIIVMPQPHEALERGTQITIDAESWVVYKVLPNVKDYTVPDDLKTITQDTHGIALLLPSVDTAKHMIVATTRPETLLGDVALVVHPDDPRYQQIIGSFVKLPCTNRSIPVLADSAVDPTYGTGVVKVTPAHDPIDYQIGERQGLEAIQVIGKDGCMTEEAGESYRGLKSSECRERVIEDIATQGLLHRTEELVHKVPISERGKDVIEPLLSEQWWINVDKPGHSLKERALRMIVDRKIQIYPERFRELFVQWLENLQDWNISRQIWWGHQMPIWYKTNGDGSLETVVSLDDLSAKGYVQEKDTFDTWFSSGQWAFSTFARHGLAELDRPETGSYVPSHTMVMGRDILLFWACRMLLLTTYRINEVPWRNILFTGLIRDEHGQKMSKSKGNGIEPGEVITKHGTDALRLGLVVSSSAGNDISLSMRKIEGYSKFVNKLWNAGKLIQMKTEGAPFAARVPSDLSLDSSRWIVNNLARVSARVTEHLRNYDVSNAANELYNFTWGIFCDWYLEIAKVIIDKGDESARSECTAVLQSCFREILILLHPLVPFITEELYQKIPGLKRGDSLCLEEWPNINELAHDGRMMNVAQEIIAAIRSVKAFMNAQYKRIKVSLEAPLSDEYRLVIAEIAKVDLVSVSELAPEASLRKPVLGGSVICEIDGKETYRARLEKELTNARTLSSSLMKKLDGPFAQHGKPELVEAEREKLRDVKVLTAQLEVELEQLGG